MTPLTSSYKYSDKFGEATDIISPFLTQNLRDSASALAELRAGLQADFTNCFDCMVRDRRSTNTSTNSGSDISNALAAFSKVANVGVALPLNQIDQCLTSTPVRNCNSLYGVSKNFSLLPSEIAYMASIMYTFVDYLVNIVVRYDYIVNIAQTTKHPRDQVLAANQYSRKDGRLRQKTYEHYIRLRGRSPSPSFTIPSVAEVGV